TPADTGVVFHVRTRDRASAQWTPWLRVGAWGRVTGKERQDNCAFGRVDVDTLRLDRPADAYQIRATLQSFGLALNVTPAVRRIAVTYSGAIAADSVWAAAMHPDAGPAERWARDLNIPYHPQGDNDYAVTDGHLIVIRGFTRSGDVIVNDPGNREKGNRVIYPAHGLAHAWFGNGGVGYVIRPPAKPLPASLVKLPPATAPSVASSNVKR